MYSQDVALLKSRKRYDLVQEILKQHINKEIVYV